jgi:transcriptional regulator with XRE-family HTH domain
MRNKLLDGLLGKKNTPNKFTVQMGEFIRNARLEERLSQSALAKYVYVSQAAISDMENGKREVSTTELLAISNILNKPIIYFFPSNYVNEVQLDKLSSLYQELLIQAKRLSDDDLKKLIAQTRALADVSK